VIGVLNSFGTHILERCLHLGDEELVSKLEGGLGVIRSLWRCEDRISCCIRSTSLPSLLNLRTTHVG